MDTHYECWLSAHTKKRWSLSNLIRLLSGNVYLGSVVARVPVIHAGRLGGIIRTHRLQLHLLRYIITRPVFSVIPAECDPLVWAAYSMHLVQNLHKKKQCSWLLSFSQYRYMSTVQKKICLLYWSAFIRLVSSVCASWYAVRKWISHRESFCSELPKYIHCIHVAWTSHACPAL